MAGNGSDRGEAMRGASPAAPRYSRSEGISAYRKRRRRGLVSRVMVGLFLLAILGGAAFMFGRQYLDPEVFPFGTNEGIPTGAKAYTDTDEEIPTMQPVEIRVMALGDVVMNGSVVESGRREGDTYSFSHLFEHLRSEIVQSDMCLISQETALAGNSFGYGNSWPLNAPQELGRSEVEAGVNVVLRATDHTLDTGTDGIHNELLWWHSEYPQIPVLGVAEPDPELAPYLGDYVSNVYVYEKEGFKVAVLNHSWNIGGESQSVVSPLTEEKVRADVEKARELGSDMIVACPHWGMEGNANTSEEETTFSRLYADLGVDVVIGTHPRVLQRAEVLEGPDGHRTVCFYSLGCFVSSLYTNNLLGGMADVTLSRDENGVCSVSSAVLRPLVTNRSNGQDFSTYLVSNYTDELAWSSWDSLTPQRLDEMAAGVLGEGYDAGAHELRVV